MENVAKINLVVQKCQDCPYFRTEDKNAYCSEKTAMKLVINDEQKIPDHCPFVLKRLDEVIKTITESTISVIPKKYIYQIERKQKNNDPDYKFGIDNGFEHINQISDIGLRLFDECMKYGFCNKESIQKQKSMFLIAAYLHDTGLADTPKSNVTHSMEIAKKYLSSTKVDIDEKDAEVIYLAISKYSTGARLETLLDAVLALSDQMDVTRDRILRAITPGETEFLKVKQVELNFFGATTKPDGIALRYVATNGFDPVLAFKTWPKRILVPWMVAQKYFRLRDFRFYVNQERYDVKALLRKIQS